MKKNWRRKSRDTVTLKIESKKKTGPLPSLIFFDSKTVGGGGGWGEVACFDTKDIFLITLFSCQRQLWKSCEIPRYQITIHGREKLWNTKQTWSCTTNRVFTKEHLYHKQYSLPGLGRQTFLYARCMVKVRRSFLFSVFITLWKEMKDIYQRK